MNYGLRKILIAAMMLTIMGAASSAMAGTTYTGISPNSGSMNNIGGPAGTDLKVATITGTNLNAVVAVQMQHQNDAAEIVTCTIVSVKADNTELYITITADATPKAGFYNVRADIGGGFVNTGQTYEMKRENNNLQVLVKMTLKARADITWDAGTGNTTTGVAALDGEDDMGVSFAADSIAAFTWIVRDGDISPAFVVGGAGYAVDLSTAGAPSYSSNDTANGTKVLRIQNVSRTRNPVDLFALATDAANATNTARWTLGGAVGTNQFTLEGSWGGGAFANLATTAPVAPQVDNLALNATTLLVLRMVAPDAIAAPVIAGEQYTSTVQITAVPQ
ncbi:MAG TPA: hypothetical protein VEK08_17275 [Planctomycetota bacterium]|nr:hypothetical protein [Planctomycetota bacterium]